MHTPETYMQRCLQLAQLGAGSTAPNPMVGAVLVHESRIIGEGHTQPYGGPHAEVMCLNSVAAADVAIVPKALLYVSLEPCAHYGKTPPCTDLIIRSGIKTVIIGCTDPFEAVNGKGVAQLQAAGISVTVGILEKECRHLNRRFFAYHQQKRPWVVLKWAQSANGQIGANGQRTAISHPLTNRLVHRWRSEEMAIMVGGRTVIVDNPRLTARHWQGKHPIRIVVQGGDALPAKLHLFDGEADTLVFANTAVIQHANASYYLLQSNKTAIADMLAQLYELKINSVLVEGGAKLLQSFINSGLWDEARIITNTALSIADGVAAPTLLHAELCDWQMLQADRVDYYIRKLRH
jgi:diaminohydroxyphosphoribosylaminopyrimidine deaminase / 5-amino-6-(5-phosphoribosylamino)uracil reductase